ncbi:MAG: FG-GAP repeat domain-containing protein, partial [Planctomycetota bacterium]
MDGDGDSDLVFGTENRTKLYLNDGKGRFRDGTQGRLPDDSKLTFQTAVALADVDADGDLDLVLGSYGYQNLLYLNDGKGTFSDATAPKMPISVRFTRAVAVGDVDGDGD